MNQAEATFHLEFRNATMIEVGDPEYYIEASGELLVDKVRKADDSVKDWVPPPFFNAIKAMGVNPYEEFKRCTLRFLALSKEEWYRVQRINELWLKGKHEYLPAELSAFMSCEPPRELTERDLLRNLHEINRSFLSSILHRSRITDVIALLDNFLPSLDSGALREALEFFERKGLLRRYQRKLFSQVEQFVRLYPSLIPVFGLRFYPEVPSGLLEEKGVTTATFDDLKQFYLDCYELIGEVVCLVAALNNVKYRRNYLLMQPGLRKDIVTLDDFMAKPKGARFDYVSKAAAEGLFELIKPLPNPELRNAIGHSVYDYDSTSQLITYSKNANSGEGRCIYLVEFGVECLSLFLVLCFLDELVFRALIAH